MDKFMGSPQWLEERRKGIGASDSPAIMGVSPWRTPYEVYLDKIGEVKPWSGNAATDWGTRMEPVLRQYYSDETGRVVRLPDKIIYHSNYPFMLASLDGFSENRVVEIKTARSSSGWGSPGTNEIPDAYMIQVQHQMFVTGFPVADVIVSIAGSPPVLYEVPEDPELQQMILSAAQAFWKRVEDRNPPEPVSFLDAVHRFGGTRAIGEVRATAEDVDNVTALRKVREEMDALKAREDDLKGKLILAIGEKGDILVDVDGSPLATYKMPKSGRTTFDSKRFEIEHPEIYVKYIKESAPVRRFLLKGEK